MGTWSLRGFRVFRAKNFGGLGLGCGGFGNSSASLGLLFFTVVDLGIVIRVQGPNIPQLRSILQILVGSQI